MTIQLFSYFIPFWLRHDLQVSSLIALLALVVLLALVALVALVAFVALVALVELVAVVALAGKEKQTAEHCKIFLGKLLPVPIEC